MWKYTQTFGSFKIVIKSRWPVIIVGMSVTFQKIFVDKITEVAQYTLS